MKIYTPEEIANKMNKRDKRKKIINIIMYPILAIIVIICTMVIFQKIQNPDKVVNIFGYKVFVIVSGSMEPTLNVGDLIITKETDNIQKNDIITFREENQSITHRVIEIVEDNGINKYKTKGDNNDSQDVELVDIEQIEGVYKFKINKIGKILLQFKNTTFIVIILIIMYIAYIIISGKDNRRIARHERRKEIEENKKEEK